MSFEGKPWRAERTMVVGYEGGKGKAVVRYRDGGRGESEVMSLSGAVDQAEAWAKEYAVPYSGVRTYKGVKAVEAARAG